MNELIYSLKFTVWAWPKVGCTHERPSQSCRFRVADTHFPKPRCTMQKDSHTDCSNKIKYWWFQFWFILSSDFIFTFAVEKIWKLFILVKWNFYHKNLVGVKIFFISTRVIFHSWQFFVKGMSWHQNEAREKSLTAAVTCNPNPWRPGSAQKSTDCWGKFTYFHEILNCESLRLL